MWAAVGNYYATENKTEESRMAAIKPNSHCIYILRYLFVDLLIISTDNDDNKWNA